ncbi:hypothetical protein ACTGU3_12460, partial [Streptococcus suis]
PIEGAEIEIVTWSVKVEVKQNFTQSGTVSYGEHLIVPTIQRDVFDPSHGAMLPTGIFDRGTLQTGDRVAGPAIITERETSTIVTAPFDAVIQHD